MTQAIHASPVVAFTPIGNTKPIPSTIHPNSIIIPPYIPVIIPPYRGGGIIRPRSTQKNGLSPFVKLLIGCSCGTVLGMMYKYLFTSSFSFPYTPEKYPQTKALYDAIDLKMQSIIISLKLKPDDLKKLTPKRFKQLLHDEFAKVNEFYKNFKKTTTYKKEICPITGEEIFFPARAYYAGGQTKKVYEAAAYYMWVNLTGRDFENTKAISVHNIGLDEKLMKIIYPKMCKQYDMRIKIFGRYIWQKISEFFHWILSLIPFVCTQKKSH